MCRGRKRSSVNEQFCISFVEFKCEGVELNGGGVFDSEPRPAEEDGRCVVVCTRDVMEQPGVVEARGWNDDVLRTECICDWIEVGDLLQADNVRIEKT